MAENNAGREERPETGSEEETSSRDYSTDSEGAVGEVKRNRRREDSPGHRRQGGVPV
jgi:hypothetical protein